MRLGLRSSAYRLLLVLAPVAAACSDTSGPGGNHRLSLHLTDAPGDFLSAVVTIEEIYLQGTDGRVTLSNTPTTVDLVDLANSTAEIVDDAELERLEPVNVAEFAVEQYHHQAEAPAVCRHRFLLAGRCP